MSQRAKTWSVAVAAAVTLLAGAIFGIGAELIGYTVMWASSLSLTMAGSWLNERYRRTRQRSFLILGIGAMLGAVGATLLLTSAVRWFDASVGAIFGGFLAGAAWAAAALINFRPFIKGADAPRPLRWRDLTAPRPQR